MPFANLVLPAIVTYDVSAGSGARGRDRDRQPLAVAWGVVFGAAVVLWCTARILEPGPPSGVPSDAEVLDLLADASSYEILVVVTQGYALLAIGVALALVSSVTRRQTARHERRDLSPAG